MSPKPVKTQPPKVPMVDIKTALSYINALKSKNYAKADGLVDKAIASTKSGKKKTRKLFNKIDTDKSGSISLKEFKAFCKKKGISAKKSKKIFDKHDKNGDKKLSRTEFSKIKLNM
tara:strand:+ start:15686 stop:16033 length:348 start_codon:yes stop_codon:yes gene_type:complete